MLLRTINILLCLLLSSCVISAGIGVHDTSRDAHMKDKPLVGFIEAETNLADDIYLYGRHESLPQTNDDNYGLNTAGVKGRFKL